jgi:hypothetical protein
LTLSSLVACGVAGAVIVDVVVQRTPAKRMFAASELPSASPLSRDSLFAALGMAGTPQNAGLRGQTSEPTKSSARRISGGFPFLSSRFL